mmetsp:Transcript_8892/g.39345  ORF Transcript_8892/g.39345 Transcript_8892/m.39345 type:complete len:90 (-) Transcript_8892:442-711(-)
MEDWLMAGFADPSENFQMPRYESRVPYVADERAREVNRTVCQLSLSGFWKRKGFKLDPDWVEDVANRELDQREDFCRTSNSRLARCRLA